MCQLKMRCLIQDVPIDHDLRVNKVFLQCSAIGCHAEAGTLGRVNLPIYIWKQVLVGHLKCQRLEFDRIFTEYVIVQPGVWL